MSNWDAPQVGRTPEIPVTPVALPTRWWKRKYRRLPVWGWAAGGLVVLSAISAVASPDDEGQLASTDDATTTTIEAPSLSDLEPTTSSAATSEATERPPTPVATVPATTVPATTVPPDTTARPTATTPTATTPSTTTEAPVSPPSGPQVSIAIQFDAAGNDNENKNDEWVRFTNGGGAPLDLAGSSIEDEGAKHHYQFGPMVLEPGDSVTVYSGCGDDTDSDRYWCNSGSAIWNNDGDVVSLFDASGALIAQRSG